MEKTFKILFNILRIVFGLYFIFSGFTKGIDPIGSAYRFNDYFTAFGWHQMPDLALMMSFLLAGAEFLIGFALVSGIFMTLTAWTALCFMIFFTALTFILAITNLVTDCGCFGDAVKLTNWETFYKNLVTFPFIAFLFFRRKKFSFKSPKWLQWPVLVFGLTVFYGVSIYSYTHLPVIDFMPYSIGTNIANKMKIPAGEPQDEYETLLLYKNKKSGEVKEFTMQNYPWQDTVNWKWADTKSVLKKKGYTPPIHDFAISDPTGNSITNKLLSDTTYSFLFISYNLNKTNPENLILGEEINAFCNATKKAKFYAITASSGNDIQRLKQNYRISYDFYTGDETALKTIIRSNPGLVLIKNGTIINKWPLSEIKGINLNKSDFLSESIVNLRKQNEQKVLLISLVTLGFVCSLLWAIVLYFKKK